MDYKVASPMKQSRGFSALPLGLAVALLSAPAMGSSIRDEAGMFSAGAISAATSQLDRFEKATKVPVIIETVDRLSLGAKPTRDEKHQAIETLAIARDRESGNRGIFLLISKADRVISNTLIPRHLASSLPEETRIAIRNAFGQGVGVHMKSEGRTSAEVSDQDAGLKSLVAAIERTTEQIIRGSAAANPAHGRRPMDAGQPRAVRGGGSGIMTFLMIGLGIMAVLFFVRVIGGLFGGVHHPSGMGGGMGMGGRGAMGPGPGGYGGPGYGGGYGRPGGGFFSGMLGGIGGALAGNWLYDQMSGRHGSHTDASSYPTSGDSGGYFSQGDEPIVGGDDGGSGGGDWGDSGGGGDWGGGDWDGGDWGGGDGGGDW